MDKLEYTLWQLPLNKQKTNILLRRWDELNRKWNQKQPSLYDSQRYHRQLNRLVLTNRVLYRFFGSLKNSFCINAGSTETPKRAFFIPMHNS